MHNTILNLLNALAKSLPKILPFLHLPTDYTESLARPRTWTTELLSMWEIGFWHELVFRTYQQL